MFFSKIFGTGGDQAASGQKTIQGILGTTSGSKGRSADFRDWEMKYGPSAVPPVSLESFNLMENFFPTFFGGSQAAFTQQDKDFENPSTTSDVASSTRDTSNKSVNVSISDADVPSTGDINRLMGPPTTKYALIATGQWVSEGVAVDPLGKTAYVGDQAGGRLYAVTIATGAVDLIASGLGDIRDVTLGQQGKVAYYADYSGGRLASLDLTASSPTPTTVASISGAYGLALDTKGNVAYVASWSSGTLYSVDLSQPLPVKPTPITTFSPAGVAGVALDMANRTAYVGRKDNPGSQGYQLYQVNVDSGTVSVVTSIPGDSTIRVALDLSAGLAYTISHLNSGSGGGRLYEITLANGAYRSVASNLKDCEGLTLDPVNRKFYISNRNNQLWQIDQDSTKARGGVGAVAQPA
ncbi:hypothetical protein ACMATS_08780 [Streptoverticillium reticulum]|uniref:hypothetical protein n=1 Tax=Streptoverticillium reticulum TaxID=1433415 RepID=UPI0039BF74C5